MTMFWWPDAFPDANPSTMHEDRRVMGHKPKPQILSSQSGSHKMAPISGKGNIAWSNKTAAKNYDQIF